MSANVLVVTDAAPRTRTASSLMQAHAAFFRYAQVILHKEQRIGQTDHGGGKHLSNQIRCRWARAAQRDGSGAQD